MSEYPWEGCSLMEAFQLVLVHPTALGPEELRACVDGAENADTVIVRMGEHIGQLLATHPDYQ